MADPGPARFAALVSDDRTILAAAHGRLIARAPQTLAGLVEIRGIGPVRAECVLERCMISLVVDLTRTGTAPRVPDAAAQSVSLCGVTLPRLRLDARGPLAAYRAAISAALRLGARGLADAAEHRPRSHSHE